MAFVPDRADLRLWPRDRIELTGVLLIACFAAVLLLTSQSGASVLTYLLTLLVLAGARRWSDIARTDLFICITGLLAYLVLSVFWSSQWAMHDVMSNLVRALLVGAFVIAVAEVRLRGQIQLWLRRTMTLVGGAAILAAIVNHLIWTPADGRLNGLGQLDTHVIAALVYGIVAVLALQAVLRESGVKWRIAGLVTIAMAFYAIHGSDSRNAWVSVIFGLSILLLAEKLKDRQRFISSVVSVVLLAGVVLVALFMGDTTRDLLLPRGTSFRPEIWDQAIARILDGHLVFGLGINTPNDFLIGTTPIQHPHNLYLSVAYQGGLVALLLLMMVLWKSLRELLRQYDEADAKLALGILGVALPAYLLDGHELLDKIGSTWFLIWLPVALAVGLRWSRSLRET
jgi:O-antigen ligase